MKKILFVGAEVMPFAATGGLGDVMGALPKTIAAEHKDCSVSVILPLYDTVKAVYREKMEKVLLKSLLWELDENWTPVRVDIEATVKNLIENGVVVREKGEWEEHYGITICPCCNAMFDEPLTMIQIPSTFEKPNFCPNCGGDMRKGKNDVR